MTDTGTAAAVKGVRDGTRARVKLPSHHFTHMQGKKKQYDNNGVPMCNTTHRFHRIKPDYLGMQHHFLSDRKYKVHCSLMVLGTTRY